MPERIRWRSWPQQSAGVTIGVLLADLIAGVAVGAGTAVVFRFVLRSIITQK